MSPEEQRIAIDRIRHSLEGSKPKTLVVEDDDNDAWAVTRVLQGYKVEAERVRTVREALDVLKDGQFRVVFLDLNLRSSEGDVVSQICQAAGSNSKVIVLTGAYSSDSDRCNAALQSGAVAIMLKPLTSDQVELIYGTP